MPDPTEQPRVSAPKAKWGLLAALAWMAVVVGGGITMVALVWSDTLGEAGRGMLACHYVAFMCQTFAYHAAVGMIPVGLLAFLSRRRSLLVGAVLVFVLGFAPECRPLWLHRGTKGSGETITLMSINLMYGRMDSVALIEQIERERPDVIVFQEWTREADHALFDDLVKTFPNTWREARDDAFGQAVFSKRPLIGEPRKFPPVAGFAEPQVTVAVMVGAREMRITDVHLLPPVGRTYFAERRAGAKRLAQWVRDSTRSDRPDVLVGDFNAPPRTGIAGAMAAAGLADAQDAAGWWRGTTWPRVGALAWVPGLRLDHVFLRDTVECVEIRVGEDFESDHRPVIAKLRWR